MKKEGGKNLVEKEDLFKPSRRAFLGKLAAIPLITSISGQAAPAVSEINSASLPLKKEFSIDGTFLNAAYTHPMSKGSLQAVQTYLDERMVNGKVVGYDMSNDRKVAMEAFAKLINASVEELAWIPSTMAGENLILSALSIPGSRSKVVTDAYHFHGSLHLYNELARQGLDVTVLRPNENGIDLKEFDAALTPGTKLVAISFVSSVNGFQHDLKAVCEIAHAKNVLVFADIIQGVGAVPVDVRESGVDFCASATYKWLMGDFGVGFLYVRKDRLDLLKRVQVGYRQIKSFTTHVFPFDAPGKAVYDSEGYDHTAGHFEVGTLGNQAVAALTYSLPLLLQIGVENIQRHRQPMIDRLQQELPKRGFAPLTRLNSTSPIVSFAYQNAYNLLKGKLEAAKINISLYENRIRISPSFYNDMDDIDKLIGVLS